MEQSLDNLIPDLPMKEYVPAGLSVISNWERFNLKTCWGYSERARRVWIGFDESRQNSLVISCEIEMTHCNRDAENIVQAVLRSEEAIRTFRLLGVELNDRLSRDESAFEWKNHGLTFRRLTFVQDRFIGEVSSVAKDNDGQVDAEVGASIRKNLSAHNEQHGQTCIHSVLLRPIWGAATALPIGVLGFSAGTIAAAVGAPQLIYVAVSVFGAVAAGWWLVGWRSRRHSKRVRVYWGQVFNQGDDDGTMRRALASVGVTLPQASGT